MKPMSVLLYEATIDDVARLPDGWSVLVYDTLYGSVDVRKKGIEPIPREKKRYVLLLHKLPPLLIEEAGK